MVLPKVFCINCYTVTDPLALAPVRWHIPTAEEWTELINKFGGENPAGAALTAKSGLKQNGPFDANGNNSSGFTAIPAGFRNWGGKFMALETTGIWWSSTPDINTYLVKIARESAGIVIRPGYPQSSGASVRCVKD